MVSGLMEIVKILKQELKQNIAKNVLKNISVQIFQDSIK